jgi:hypothetical protein
VKWSQVSAFAEEQAGEALLPLLHRWSRFSLFTFVDACFLAFFSSFVLWPARILVFFLPRSWRKRGGGWGKKEGEGVSEMNESKEQAETHVP